MGDSKSKAKVFSEPWGLVDKKDFAKDELEALWSVPLDCSLKQYLVLGH